MFAGNVPNIILVCCILHNICEIHGEIFNDEWLEDLDLMQPDEATVLTATADGGTVRDLLVIILILNYIDNAHFLLT